MPRGAGSAPGGDIDLLRESRAERRRRVGAQVLPRRIPAQPPADDLSQAHRGLHGRHHHGRRRGHRTAVQVPRRDREHPLRHARDRHRPVSRRRRRLVPVAAARAARPVPRAHRRAARRGGVPVGGDRHALRSQRDAGRGQGADHREAGSNPGRCCRKWSAPRPGRGSKTMPTRSRGTFAPDRYEDILASLEADDSEWATKELRHARAPRARRPARSRCASWPRPPRFEDFAQTCGRNTASPAAC